MISTPSSRGGRSIARQTPKINMRALFRRGTDLGEWLVRNGLALDWPQYSKGRYDAVQRTAEQAGRGMWAGSYVEPWLYRVCIRASVGGADHRPFGTDVCQAAQQELAEAGVPA